MVSLKKDKKLKYCIWAADFMGISYGQFMALISEVNPLSAEAEKRLKRALRKYYEEHKEDFKKKGE